MPGEECLPHFGAEGVNADHGIHAIAVDIQVAVAGEAHAARRHGEWQADDGLTAGHIVDGQAAIDFAGGDELAAVLAEAGERRFAGGVNRTHDGSLRERDDGDGAIGAGDYARIVGFQAEVEIVGRRRELDAAAWAQGVEGNLHQAGWVAIEDPECIAGAGEAHGDRLVAGAYAAGDGEQAGFDFIDGAGIGCQHVGFGGLGYGENL